MLVRDAHMNILRIWGGGFVNKESFFELCDELGIMVWQEFPLACNEYPDEEHYLSVLKKEATSIVRRLRTHPCAILYCGGNELFNNWSLMTDQHHALRLLNAVCYEEDRCTPFIATSPLNGMGHGSYLNYDETIDEEAAHPLRAQPQHCLYRVRLPVGVPGELPAHLHVARGTSMTAARKTRSGASIMPLTPGSRTPGRASARRSTSSAASKVPRICAARPR